MSLEQYSPWGGLRGVEVDDIVTGCWEWLRSKPDLMNLLGAIPGSNPRDPFLYANKNLVALNILETNAVVIKHAGGWGAPNPQNTMEFPRIEIQFWCDAIRGDDGKVVEENEAIRRLEFIYKKFDRYLHRPAALENADMYDGVQGKIQMWGTVRTIGCVRLGELAFNVVPDADGMFLGNVFYGVTVA